MHKVAGGGGGGGGGGICRLPNMRYEQTVIINSSGIGSFDNRRHEGRLEIQPL